MSTFPYVPQPARDAPADAWDGMDDLDAAPAGRPAPAPQAKPAPAAQLGMGVARSSDKPINQVAQFRCPHCVRGRWMRAGRDYGLCRRCKGTGLTKTDPVRAAARKQARAKQHLKQVVTWIDEHQPEMAWIGANSARFEFAAAMAYAVGRYGALTEAQLAAAHKCMARDVERAQQKAARPGDADLAGAGFARMLAAFARAAATGLKNPKFRVAQLTFSPAKAASTNAGFICVKSSDTYVGKISASGQFFGGRDCSPVVLAEIVRIGRDPLAAAVLHGHQTGQCSCCGRELENAESVRLGIGPICRERWGL